MKHTSGPWNYAGYYDHCEVGREYHEVTDSQGFEIINQNGIVTTEQDALLIAAAPELLDALTALLNWGRDHLSPVHNPEAHTLLVAAHNAINKATQYAQETKERKGQK